ncbi:hypothetical protein DPEC_G00143550 [Dallia pectoralis]|uniref:Uncharacterized protein n=1 Tax=Dallia pectoralis TaxID=75939 RepID=A0ACC2GN88_DALPE|nr:hypothetical protein DPEC_G00143550 [Dallia pectoralis]
MVKLELEHVVLRRMREDDIETVKAIIKEGCQGTENRLILHILTRPVCLLLLATISSVLRCFLHNFILALVIPVFLLIVYLKVTLPRSIGVLGTSRSYWDYVGSSYRGCQDDTLINPYSRIGGKPVPAKGKARRRTKLKPESTDATPEIIDVEREKAAGQVWVADCEGEIVACVSREGDCRQGIRRICRLVVSCWYRREGLGRLLIQGLEQRERKEGASRVYAHVPYPSAVGEAFFRKLGYRLLGEVGYDGEEEEDEEQPEKAFLGFHITKVFVKDLK